MKAVIYLRVSSKEQKQEGYSIPAQRKLLLDYAKAHDFKIVKEFEDNETAKSSGREGYGEMIEYLAKNKETNTVLVEKTDRLYRNFKDYVTMDEVGATVFLVKENEVVGKNASSHQKFIHGIKVLMAKNFIDNLSEETRKGLTEKAESGIYPGNKLTVGYKLDSEKKQKGALIDEANKDLPIRMYDLYATGFYSLERVIEKVKEENLFRPELLPKGSELKKLTKSTAHRILRNPFYYGWYYWNKKLYKGLHTPLIDKELWDKVQKLLNKSQDKPQSKYNTMDFAFKGLMVCGDCGRTVTAEKKIKASGKEYIYYHCTKFGTHCKQRAANETSLNELIVESLDIMQKMPQEAVDYVAEGLKGSLYVKRNTEDKTRLKLEAEKTKLQGRLSVLYEDRLDKKITDEFYNQRFEEYSSRVKELDDLISKYTYADLNYYEFGAKTLELAKQAATLYKNALPEERHELLGFLLSNSTLKDGNGQFIYKKPFDRVLERARSSNWQGLRDDFRTMNWPEIIHSYGYSVKTLDLLLAR